MDVTYYLDGVDLKTYGVYISKSEGLLSRPRVKPGIRTDWADYHGEVVDLSQRVYEARKITLTCFIYAENKESFITKANTFLDAMDLPGTRRLMVVVDPTKPLLYEVYLAEGVELSNAWSDDAMVGTFVLELVEPSPLKRVVKHIRTGAGTATLTVTVTTTKMLDIYWGDGAVTRNVTGAAQAAQHTYTTNGTYYAVVTGNIDEIGNFSTNGTVLWTKL